MNAQLIIAILQAVPFLVEDINNMKAKGEITLRQQNELEDAIRALRATDFSGPEWQIIK